VEERGFESLFLPEHTHVPVSRRTPYPGGGELPDEYRRTFDPFVALTAAAMNTTRLRLGTGVCLVVQRDPIVLAKEVASLDRISGGRFLFGVGAGWNREEMADHGTDPATRMSLFAERMHAMRRIWTEDEPSYHGRYVRFEPMWSWPKPAQRPHPPVLVGGNGPGVLDRVLDFGDGWMPLAMPDPASLLRRVEELRRRVDELGRPAVPVSVYAARANESDVASYAAAGIQRCLFYLPSADRDRVLGKLDRVAQLRDQLAG
jgi:probable F420-dependent oxidoreductase